MKKKLLFSVVTVLSVLMLNVCISSCGEDEVKESEIPKVEIPPDPDTEGGKAREPIEDKGVIASPAPEDPSVDTIEIRWAIAEKPYVQIAIDSKMAEARSEVEKANNLLSEKMFLVGDQYLFKANDSVEIYRSSLTVPSTDENVPKKYKIENNKYLTFDGYIKFLTHNVHADTITLTANNEEVQRIIEERLQTHPKFQGKDGKPDPASIKRITDLCYGRVRLVLARIERKKEVVD
jgi:hypothetical protein